MAVLVSRMFFASTSNTPVDPTDPAPELSYADVKVGNSVFLPVNGVATEFLVVHKGIPDSTMYDSSCTGLWLMMKDLYTEMAWDSETNEYATSDVHEYLNTTFFNSLDSELQSAIKQVKIPYQNSDGANGTLATGADGLSTKVFLPSFTEVHPTNTYEHDIVDGAGFEYFAEYDKNKLIAYYEGEASYWWTRTPYDNQRDYVYRFASGGGSATGVVTYEYGVRPTLVLPNTVVFDAKTFLFKGVK